MGRCREPSGTGAPQAPLGSRGLLQVQRRRQESNLLDSRVAADRLAVRPRRHQRSRAGGGTRTHTVCVTRAAPGLSGITGWVQWPVLVSSQLDRGSKPPSPAEGLAGSRSCRSRTCQLGFVDPALEAARQPAVPRAGVEPADRPSEGRCLEPQDRASSTVRVFGGIRTRRLDLHRVACSPVTPQTPSVTREGLEPSRHGGHGLLRTACLRSTTWPIANSGPWRELNLPPNRAYFPGLVIRFGNWDRTDSNRHPHA